MFVCLLAKAGLTCLLQFVWLLLDICLTASLLTIMCDSAIFKQQHCPASGRKIVPEDKLYCQRTLPINTTERTRESCSGRLLTSKARAKRSCDLILLSRYL